MSQSLASGTFSKIISSASVIFFISAEFFSIIFASFSLSDAKILILSVTSKFAKKISTTFAAEIIFFVIFNFYSIHVAKQDA